MLSDGIHEPIVDVDLWEKAQDKRQAQGQKYEYVNKSKDTKIHLLSGLIKCLICGVGMYGNKSVKKKIKR